MPDSQTELHSLARQLVRIPTENPPGDEAVCAEFVHEWFDERDIDATRVEEPDPDRPQVGARIGSGSPTIVLNGHLDVVPAGDPDDWSVDPYGGVVRDGRLYGRGSADMKTGLAVAMIVANDLAPDIRSGDLSGSIVVHAAMGEESADPGTRTLLERGYDGDFGIVLEPTDFRVATSTKGQAVYTIAVDGEAGHSSQPDAGRNAIDEIRPVLDAIDDYDEELRDRPESLCGTGFATVTGIEAGTDSNFAVIPDRAEISLDRRVVPGESLATVDDEIDSLLNTVATDHDLEATWTRVTAYAASSIPVADPYASRLRELSASALESDKIGQPWGIEAATDMRNFVNDAGIPAVTWGPGDLGQAHSVDESISLTDASTARTVLRSALREFLA